MLDWVSEYLGTFGCHVERAERRQWQAVEGKPDLGETSRF